METDYSKCDKITVKTQGGIRPNTKKILPGRYTLNLGRIFSPAIVRDKFGYHVEAMGNSSVEARGNSSVEAWENSSVVAWEHSSVVSMGKQFC